MVDENESVVEAICRILDDFEDGTFEDLPLPGFAGPLPTFYTSGMTDAQWANRLRVQHGASWCFDHQRPIPCEICEARPAFIGVCFDCKAELAADGEPTAMRCDCGSLKRAKRLYR